MAGVIGTPRSYHKKWMFKVEIDGLDIAWFQSVSGLEQEVGIVEQHEGGNPNVADQSPGKIKNTPITLVAGVTVNSDLWDWWQLVVDATTGLGLPDEQYKRTVVISQLDRDGTVLKRWTLAKAWPHKYTGGEWDAKSEENVVESIVLVYQRGGQKKAA